MARSTLPAVIDVKRRSALLLWYQRHLHGCLPGACKPPPPFRGFSRSSQAQTASQVASSGQQLAQGTKQYGRARRSCQVDSGAAAGLPPCIRPGGRAAWVPCPCLGWYVPCCDRHKPLVELGGRTRGVPPCGAQACLRPVPRQPIPAAFVQLAPTALDKEGARQTRGGLRMETQPLVAAPTRRSGRPAALAARHQHLDSHQGQRCGRGTPAGR